MTDLIAAAERQVMKERLEERLTWLNARLHGIEDALDAEPPKDFEDRATEREDDEVLETLGRDGLHEVEMIKAALHRIEDGSYGICAGCGQDIPLARLDAVPHAARCVRCA